MERRVSLNEAAQALVDHFGGQIEASRDEGRRLMADALHDRLDIPKREARQMVDALEHARSIRWVEGHSSTANAPIIPGDFVHWQLEPA